MITPPVPAGWAVEPEDRSVGIFGDFIWHDSCPNPQDDISEAVVDDQPLYHVGSGANRTMRVIRTFTCQDCAAIEYMEYDEWDPDIPEDPEDMA